MISLGQAAALGIAILLGLTILAYSLGENHRATWIILEIALIFIPMIVALHFIGIV